MRERNPAGLVNFDLITFSIFLGLVAIGWLMIYTVGFNEGYRGGLSGFLTTPAGKQSIWIGICTFIFIFILLIDWKFWQTFAYPLYAGSMLLLLGVLFFGVTIKGATSWYSFGSFSFQPSELAKFGTALAISAYLSAFNTDLKNLRSQLTVAALLLTPMVLIMMQPDAGSALVFISFLVVLYREGLSSYYYLVGFYLATILILGLIANPLWIAGGLGLLGLLVLAANFKARNYWLLGSLAFAGLAIYLVEVVDKSYILPVLGAITLALLGMGTYLFWNRKAKLIQLMSITIVVGIGLAFASNYFFNEVLQPHQQNRINAWLRPDKCDKAALYNVVQSKMAISSGGLQGKGFLKGTMTKLNYVPEQTTDFIFCTVGEEQGFVGSLGIIGLFFLLMLRITIIAERQRSSFARTYAYAVAGILFIHVFINIGMTMGLMPIIGIPLPMISKGGSSLIGFTIMIAVLLKIDSNRFRYV
ncbi:MAG: rod shape-determining protein RodA [Bacteroidota bacterium]